jgi:hypothetical protein
MELTLEQQADDILAADRRAYRAKEGQQHNLVHGILSPDQEQLRVEREVYATSGRVDGRFLRGMYRRSFNPDSRNLPSWKTLQRGDPWRQAEAEFWDNEVAGSWLPSARREEIIGGQSFGPGLDRWEGLPDFTRRRHWWFLDRYQRCRIRAEVRRDPSLGRRREIAQAYGVPTWVIYRLANS